METGTTDEAELDVRRDSDGLLKAVRELHDLERDKRSMRISSPEFHDSARQITDRSREVFRIAAEEERDGDETVPSERTTEDVGR